MELVIGISFLIMILMGFQFMKKVDLFIEKNLNNIDNTKRTDLFHLGFDSPTLAEDFMVKMNEADKNQHCMETIIYTGSEKDMLDMLNTGKLDYIILTHRINDWSSKSGECKELLLKSKSLKTQNGDLSIDSYRDDVKADVFWIPKWIEKDKEYFSELLKEQS